MLIHLSRLRLFALLLLLTLGVLLGCAASSPPAPDARAESEEAAAEALAAEREYLFCFWNVENLFDDHHDKRPKADEPYDTWFSSDKEALEQKLDNLCKALLKMNDGRGPDILAIVEVES